MYTIDRELADKLIDCTKEFAESHFFIGFNLDCVQEVLNITKRIYNEHLKEDKKGHLIYAELYYVYSMTMLNICKINGWDKLETLDLKGDLREKTIVGLMKCDYTL